MDQEAGRVKGSGTVSTQLQLPWWASGESKRAPQSLYQQMTRMNGLLIQIQVATGNKFKSRLSGRPCYDSGDALMHPSCCSQDHIRSMNSA